MALETLDITEAWDSLQILTKAQLHQAMLDLETYQNTKNNGNFQQIGLDVFGVTYTYNNDGLQSVTTPLIERVGLLDTPSTVAFPWTFDDTVQFNDAINSTSTFTSSGQMRVRAYRVTSAQSINDITLTALSFGAETYDVGAMHDNSSNPSRFTIPSGGNGLYEMMAQAEFAANATGRREIYIYKNGSEVARTVSPSASAGFTTRIQVVSGPMQLSVGDYLEAYVFQSSGGALNVNLGEFVTFAACVKLC